MSDPLIDKWAGVLSGLAASEREDTLIADNARLRALIKEAEMAATDRDRCAECPWCELGSPHAIDCRAFTPDGQVK